MANLGPFGIQPRKRQGRLFGDAQAWVHAEEDLDEARGRERQILLESLGSLANSELGSVEQRVAYILQRYPETRDDRRLLVLRYWYRYNAEILASWEPAQGRELDILLALDNFTTIDRMARLIQNTLKLYSGNERYKKFRTERQLQFSRYLAQQTTGVPEIRLYLDETGTDRQSGYVAVAGICVVDARQYEKFYAALRIWRENLRRPAALHASEIVEDTQDHLALVRQIDGLKGGLLFVGHAIETRIASNEMLVTLFMQLALDTLRHLDSNGCLTEPKGLVVVKEAEEAFDKIYRSTLVEQLEGALATEFTNRVFLKDVFPLPKGREVMLELADHIAFGLHRGRSPRSRHPKDLVADAVLNMSGLDDPRERGVVFKLHR